MTQRATLNGVTIYGDDCDADLILLDAGIEGLGFAESKASDLVRGAGLHGVVAGDETTLARILRIPTVAKAEADPEAAMQILRTLKEAWQPVSVDQALDVYVPGIGPVGDTLRFYGRPRSPMDVSLARLAHGVVFAFPTFVAADPVGYGPEETVNGSGTFAVSNPGDAVVRRGTIVITGDGGTPNIANATDGAGYVAFTQTLGIGQTWTLDLYRRTVVDSGGNDVFDANVSAASPWFALQPGSNSITLTGAASADVTYRGGWW